MKKAFVHGNYPSYYSYRTDDDRLVTIDAELKDSGYGGGLESLLKGKTCLDIGCNSGKITTDIAIQYSPKWILGMDIDPSLIYKARRHVASEADRLGIECTKDEHGLVDYHLSRMVKGSFPWNVRFMNGDILSTASLRQVYDVVFCLSVTKWIHLNSGDSGIIELFKRILEFMKPGGILVLEPQAFATYARRKKLSPEIEQNYKAITLKPESFETHLNRLGLDTIVKIGSLSESKGFNRCIILFKKRD